MSRMIYGESVQGASHIRSGTPCQDSYKKVIVSEDIVLIAVADGHGSASCPYSKTGSKIATNVFCSVMENLIRNFSENMDFFMTYLNREGELKVSQAIDAEWKKRVWKVHTDNKREKPVNEKNEIDKVAIYKQYGTTLLGIMITSTFIFSFQLGDGDIVYVNKKEIQPVIECEKILGTETYSLCRIDAWEKAITLIRKRDISEDTPYLYLLASDGFSNSYRSESEFHVSCRDYFTIIQEHGFKAVSENLKEWLIETSKLGCGDDITVVLVYFDGTEAIK